MKNSDKWETPQIIVDNIARLLRINFTLDGCAEETNKKCKRYLSQSDDYLNVTLSNEVIWCNPPYSNPIPFIEASIRHSQNNTVVMLLNYDPSTKWFSLIEKNAAGIYPIIGFYDDKGTWNSGRINFIHHETKQIMPGNAKPQVFCLFDAKELDGYENAYIRKNELIHEE